MSESTAIRLPSSLPYPVIISLINCRRGEQITKHKEIFSYKYWTYQDDPNSKEEPPKKVRVECIGTFESPIEGEVERINVKPNEEILHSNIDILQIKEACAHTVQYGGLCALCGKALDEEKDYSGYDYEERATIAMSHDSTELKISYDEAAKIESKTTDRLIEEQKLILVVDLDQTVIHATVDPTVGEWQSDPANPNYPAVKDVKTFCLEEDPVVPPGWTGPRLPPTRCWYYVKLRPGLQEFLRKMDEKYEMHIYTMATRNYALAIANIIDPDGKYFGDRILSRDESGSLTHKNLKRLFPVDQSMVAIIDDRGDVWQWERNLIKVVPYDFFVGIGDINSMYLPKKKGQLTGPIKKRKAIAKLEAAAESKIEEEEEKEKEKENDAKRGGGGQGGGDNDGNGASSDSSIEAASTPIDAKHDISANPVERILELGGGEGNTNLLLEQSRSRNQTIEQQQHDRPLAKLQHDLIQMHHIETKSVDSQSDDGDDSDDDDNLLLDDDNELLALDKILQDVHREYYHRYKSSKDKPNLTEVIPQMKSKCLTGITILFSGIIPRDINIENADIVIWCKQFGVQVVNEVFPEVTHVVCRDISEDSGPTFKARAANRLYGDRIKIVNPDWLFSCLSSWKKQDEKDYLVNTSDAKLWNVKESDVNVYAKKLEEIKAAREAMSENRGRSGSMETLDDYDLDEANQEIDEFLAGLSDDEDEEDQEGDQDQDQDQEEDQNGQKRSLEDADEDEDEELQGRQTANGHDSFIKEMYKKRKKLASDHNHDIYEDEDEKETDAQETPKAVQDDDVGGELNDLEQELLDGFNDLED
ncbi:uncharacterized protein LODBEIA_P32540 [Lodderomyces beijingensis]|uniref:RNA polymerase II subunit A C-terminal domain phosphatase n=1 Tax=Lodderomyces beijingensis TaxID=1775926 RepID=A0ABP0ZS40_9ASCO